MAKSTIIKPGCSGEEKSAPVGLKARLPVTRRAPGPTLLCAAGGCRAANFFKGPELTRAIFESHGDRPRDRPVRGR